jgi:hypothetical protein
MSEPTFTVTPADTLLAIAGMVGCEDPFNAEPRDIYARVRRIVREHEAMRARLGRICDEAEGLSMLLADVECEDPR